MIHDSTTPRALGVVRVWVFGLWLFITATHPLAPLAGLPEGVHAPLGLLRLLSPVALDVLTGVPALTALDVLLPVLLALALLGVRPYHPVATLATVGLALHQSLLRGFGGQIQHGELALLYAAFILAIFPAADGFAWPARNAEHGPAPRYSAALLLMTLVLLGAYSFIGNYRLAHGGGIAVFFNDSMAHHIAYNTFTPSSYGFTAGIWVLASPALLIVAKVGFAITTLFEILAPLCLVFRRFRWLWIAVMVPFHVSTLFLMNIFFWEHLLLFPVLLVGARTWRTIWQRVRQWKQAGHLIEGAEQTTRATST